MRLKMIIHVFISLLILSSFLRLDAHRDRGELNIINIGLSVDMGSWVGKVVLSCVHMAISDINAFHGQNGTRIVLHTRDSKGQPLTAMNAAKDLLERVKVEAIVVPEMTSEASMMATLVDESKVPMFSFTSIPLAASSHPYFLQVTEEENIQFKGITALLETFKWRNIVLIHDDPDDGRNILPQLLEEFQEKNIHVIYKNANSFSTKCDQLIEEFDKAKMVQPSVFVVHTSPSLASKIFMNLKRLGMMSEGYAWLVTSKTMNFLDSMDSSVIESMQGVSGFKSYVPTSSKLQNFTLRWRNKVQNVEPPLGDLNILGLRAYNTMWALANSFASLKTKSNFSGSEFLGEIYRSEFRGLGGDFQFVNGKLVVEGYEVVNVIGKGESKVGFWSVANGFTKEVYSSVNEQEKHAGSSINHGLKTIIWPGLTTNAPKGWWFQASRKKLRIAYPANGLKECIRRKYDIYQNNVTTVTGFCKDVFDAAIQILGYPILYDLIPIEDTPTYKKYNELVYQVYLKKYDGAIGDITITPNRSLYVDFTLPFTDLGIGKVARLNSQNRWYFLKPLDTDLWITLACFFILLGIVIWLLEHPTNEEFQGSRAQQIATILWFSVSTLVYAHRERLRSNLSKFIVGVWLFVVFIFAASYTAILSSILTVQQIQSAKGSNIFDVVDHYRRGAHSISFSFEDYNAYYSMDKYNDALSRGSENGGVDAIIDEIFYMKVFLARYPSNHALTDPSSTTNGFGFVFQKGSSLVPEISRAIAKLREDGTLLELEKKWYNQAKEEQALSSQGNDEQIGPHTLSLKSFLGLFFISGLSKIIVLLILVICFLRKKLSLNHHIVRILGEGRFPEIVRLLTPRMANAIEGSSIPR